MFLVWLGERPHGPSASVCHRGGDIGSLCVAALRHDVMKTINH